MSWFEGFIFVLLSASASVSCKDGTDLLPKDPVVQEGAAVSLQCLAEPFLQKDNLDIKFEIKNMNGKTVKMNDTIESYSDRLYVEYFKKPVKLEDAGNYTCTVMADEKVQPTVLSYVHVIRVNTRPEIVKTETKPARLDCLLPHQDELLKVEWMKDKEVIQNNDKYKLDGPTLVIHNVEVKDSEYHYKCVVASKSALDYYGTIANATKHKATMTARKQLIVVKVQQDLPGNWTCNVYGSHQATIEWMDKDGTSLNATIGYNETQLLTFSDATNVTNLGYVEVTVEGVTKNFTDLGSNKKDVPDAEGSNTVAIGVGVSVGIVIIVVVIAAVYCYRKKNKKKQGDDVELGTIKNDGKPKDNTEGTPFKVKGGSDVDVLNDSGATLL